MIIKDILVVDDDQDILNTLKEYLENECGYSVETATSAMTGLTKLVEKKFDVLISDINMPRMTGMELIMRVKGSYPDIAIIMISAVRDSKNIVRAMKLGADDFIPKPFILKDVKHCLSSLAAHKKKRSKPITEKKHVIRSFGDYRIMDRIGMGGMGTVYCAEQVSTGKTVALKILYPHLIKDDLSFQRFLREAQIIGEFDHPNIVKGVDVGRLDGDCFIAMELIDGKDLYSIIEDAGSFDIPDGVHIIKQMFEVLQYIHDKNVIHRDIKPSNILVAKDNTVKLVDLGLTKHLDEKYYLTDPGTVFGSIGYMPPEAILDVELDIRSDIYALGSTMYFMFTGKNPFQGEINHVLVMQRQYVPSTREFNLNVPEKLDKFIKKMMAVKREDRFQTPKQITTEFFKLGL